MTTLRVCMLLLVLGLAGCASTQPWQRTEGQHPELFKKELKLEVTTRFQLYLPKGFATEKKRWPLLIFLHGSGESGEDVNKVKVHGPPKLADMQEFPFIIVSPQSPDESGWWPMLLNAMLDEVIAQLPIDTDRVYLTGLSMGGYGTWYFALQYPQRFAAIAPVCGGGTTYLACRLKGVPVWAFHGAKDNVVPLSEDQDMVDAVKKCGGRAKLTIYPDAGHNAWTQTYSNPELYKWFLQHIRKR